MRLCGLPGSRPQAAAPFSPRPLSQTFCFAVFVIVYGLFPGRVREKGWAHELVRLQTAQQPRGVARINAGLGNVPAYHCPRSNHYMVANLHREDGRIGTHTDVTTNCCGMPEFMPSFGRTANRKEIVDEHCAVRDKTIVANRHHIANEGMRLNPTAFPHYSSSLDLNKWANETFVADDATIKIDGLHDGDRFTERDVHHADMLGLWFSHKLLIRPPRRHRRLGVLRYRNYVASVA